MANGTPQSIGMKPIPGGGTAIIDNVTWYSDGETWQTTPFPPKQPMDLGRKMLGFEPKYQKPVDHFTEPGGTPSGPANLDPHMYLTKEDSERLAALLGATVVEVDGATVDSGSIQYELEIPGAKNRVNAGRVANSIMTQPKTALKSLAADAGLPPPPPDNLPAWYAAQNLGLTDVPLAERKNALNQVSALIAELNNKG